MTPDDNTSVILREEVLIPDANTGGDRSIHRARVGVEKTEGINTIRFAHSVAPTRRVETDSPYWLRSRSHVQVALSPCIMFTTRYQ